MHQKEKGVLRHPPTLRPMDWLRFVQIDPFPARWKKLKLSDDDLRALEICIMVDPVGHPVIKESGGLRKLRFAPLESNQGKRGLYRVFYAFFEEFSIVLLIAVIAKNEEDDLPRSDLHAIRGYLSTIQTLLQEGRIR